MDEITFAMTGFFVSWCYAVQVNKLLSNPGKSPAGFAAAHHDL
jgi:hypothetical protein